MLRVIAVAALLVLALFGQSITPVAVESHHTESELAPLEPVKHGAVRVSRSLRVSVAFQRTRQISSTLGTAAAFVRPPITTDAPMPVELTKRPAERGTIALYRPRARSALDPTADA